MEKDDQYYFRSDQYFSSVKRGVVDLDDKVFKIYTQALLHYRRSPATQHEEEAIELGKGSGEMQMVSSIYLNKSTLMSFVDK